MKVLIIGAGLGGLTLAQCLRKAGIDYEIFERDETQEARQQGWALTLHWILQEFVLAMPKDLPPLSDCSVLYPHLEIPSTIGMYEANSPKCTFWFEVSPMNPGIRVNRHKFRNWLATNISVTYGKKFTNYTQDADTNTVTAHFADGSQATGDILVGADGMHSKVRSQLLGGVEPETTPLGLICGNMTLSKELTEKRREFGSVTMLAGSAAAGVRILVGCQELLPDERGIHYWVVSYSDPSAPETLPSLSKQQLLDTAMEKLRETEMMEQYLEGLEQTQIEDIDYKILHSWVPPNTLPAGRITLLGDAAHGILPFRGEGGNVAIRDAVQLGATICGGKQINEALQLSEVDGMFEKWLKNYEEVMLKRGIMVTEESREAAATVHGHRGEEALKKFQATLLSRRVD